jgi:hypothetical protein
MGRFYGRVDGVVGEMNFAPTSMKQLADDEAIDARQG